MLVVMSVMVVTWIDAGRLASSCGRIARILLTTVMVLAPGWRWMFKNDRGGLIHPGRLPCVLDAIHHVGYISHEDRSAVAVRDHDIPVSVCIGDLVVRVDLVVLSRAIEVAFGGIHTGLGQAPCAHPPCSARKKTAATGFTWMRTAGF